MLLRCFHSCVCLVWMLFAIPALMWVWCHRKYCLPIWEYIWSADPNFVESRQYILHAERIHAQNQKTSTWRMWKINSKLTVSKIPEQLHSHHSGVLIVICEHIFYLLSVFIVGLEQVNGSIFKNINNGIMEITNHLTGFHINGTLLLNLLIWRLKNGFNLKKIFSSFFLFLYDSR